MKKYIVLGGVNGAGKSTLYQILDNLKKMPRVNTDEIVKELGDWRNTSDVLKAGKIAVQLIDKYFSEGISFNQESTLCGKSIIKNFNRAKQSIKVRLLVLPDFWVPDVLNWFVQFMGRIKLIQEL